MDIFWKIKNKKFYEEDEKDDPLDKASEEFKNDKEFVKKSLKTLYASFQYASNSLKKDREFVLSLLDDKSIVNNVLNNCNYSLMDDEEIIIKATEKSGTPCLIKASYRLKGERDFILKLVKVNGLSLRFVSKKEIFNDKEIGIEAIKNNPESIKYLSDQLLSDKNFILETMNINPLCFKWLTKFHNNKEIALEAVSLNGWNLEYLSEDLQFDKEIILSALKNDSTCFIFVPEDLSNDKEVYLMYHRMFNINIDRINNFYNINFIF